MVNGNWNKRLPFMELGRGEAGPSDGTFQRPSWEKHFPVLGEIVLFLRTRVGLRLHSAQDTAVQ